MLAEMNSKEQSYRMEFGTFLPLRADGNVTLPSPDEPATAFYPISPNSASFESAREATSVADNTLWPTAWKAVGVSPRDTSLYCTYMTNAGGAGQAVPAGATFGAALVAGVAAPWFYGLAACNMNGPAGISGGRDGLRDLQHVAQPSCLQRRKIARRRGPACQFRAPAGDHLRHPGALVLDVGAGIRGISGTVWVARLLHLSLSDGTKRSKAVSPFRRCRRRR